MRSRIPMAAAAWLLCSAAVAAEPPAAAPPEEQASSGGTQAAMPADPAQSSPDRYADLNKRVQEKLQALGFYDGPVNGVFGPYTQAALAQFQLSMPLPVSGSLDETTMAALGIQARDETVPQEQTAQQ